MGRKSAAVRRCWFERVERVERVERERFLTTDDTDLHGWKWWDLFLSYFDGRVEHKEHKDFFGRGVGAFTFHEK